MQITGVTQYHLTHGLDGSFDPTWVPGYPQGTHECELFEIETDDGITGHLPGRVSVSKSTGASWRSATE